MTYQVNKFLYNKKTFEAFLNNDLVIQNLTQATYHNLRGRQHINKYLCSVKNIINRTSSYEKFNQKFKLFKQRVLNN